MTAKPEIVFVADPEGVSAQAAAEQANQALLASYSFDKYKTLSDGKTVPARKIEIRTTSVDLAQKRFDDLRLITDSVFWASDLVNEPGNVLNPQTYAERIAAELAPLGITVRVIDAAEMKALGMNTALAVGQGSATPPCMVVMEYDGSNGRQDQPLALVGKGITFDSGGISIKPGAGMGEMTMDMGGSAAVVGAMRALASRKAKAKVVAIVGLAENMPSGTAYRPGDIVKSMNGKTVYIGNTDAEGRLVLADAMTYIQRTYNPHTMVDLATLTGAAVAALGKEFAAIFTNDDSLRAKFNKASAVTGEKTWPMPLLETDAFKKAVRATPHADLTNLAGGPGASTAAAFLHEFVEKDARGKDKCAWVHIDMAGPGIPSSPRKGWGVMLLDALVRDNYEVKKAPPAKRVAPKR